VKRAQVESAADERKKGEAAKDQDRQKILTMKDLALADLYKPRP
jgi:hypothetical protein